MTLPVRVTTSHASHVSACASRHHVPITATARNMATVQGLLITGMGMRGDSCRKVSVADLQTATHRRRAKEATNNAEVTTTNEADTNSAEDITTSEAEDTSNAKAGINSVKVDTNSAKVDTSSVVDMDRIGPVVTTTSVEDMDRTAEVTDNK